MAASACGRWTRSSPRSGAALRDKPGEHAVVMRSTVPPGTAEDRVIPALEQPCGKRHGEGFRYYSNPEFLREGSSVRDFHAPPYTLIGAAPGDDGAVLREIYRGVGGEVHVAPYRVAESVKMLANAYHAVKLAFANEGGAILAALGVDARAAYKLFCEDRVLNISPAYLTPGFAFGGSCLPKDMRSLLALADQAHVPAPFLKQVLPSNQALIERTFEAIARHGRQRVALFGLAFKQGTDDLRESPFVLLAEKLIGKGFEVSIFDRSVQVARLTGSNRAYIEREIPHLERLLAPEPADAVAGAGLVVVGHLGARRPPGPARRPDRPARARPGGHSRAARARGHHLSGPVLVTQKRLLVLSPRFLFPLDQGGRIRTANTLRHMKGGAFHLTLLSPAPADAARWAAETAASLRPLPVLAGAGHVARRPGCWPWPGRLPVAVATDASASGRAVVAAALAERPDAILVDFPHAAVLLPPRLEIPAIMFTHNVEAEIFARHAEVARGPMRLVWQRRGAQDAPLRGRGAAALPDGDRRLRARRAGARGGLCACRRARRSRPASIPSSTPTTRPTRRRRAAGRSCSPGRWTRAPTSTGSSS